MKHRLILAVTLLTVVAAIILFANLVRMNDDKSTDNMVPNLSPVLTSTFTNATSPGNEVVTKPEQENCPNGFYVYENEAFSICYPAQSEDFYPQELPSGNIVSVGHQNITLEVNARDQENLYADDYPFCNPETGACNPPDCWLTKENTLVSNFPSVRRIYRNVATGGSDCQKITEITTYVKYRSNQFFSLRMAVAYAEDTTPSLNLDQYLKIEKSIKIK